MNAPDQTLFSPLDEHFANLICEMAGTSSTELRLAAKLASFRSGQGHVCITLAEIAGREQRVDGFPPEIFPTPSLANWTSKLRNSGVVGDPGAFAPLILDSANRLYLRRYWEYQDKLARDILSRAAMPLPAVDGKLLRDGLALLFPSQASGDFDWQKLAAFTAATRRLTVITGGPGTGKTRTVVAILALLLQQAKGAGLKIALCAPTGKAAARLTESIQGTKAQLQDRIPAAGAIPAEATTIHRLLGAVPDSPYFQRNRNSPLLHDVVVVDEVSMVDLALMAKLFDAIRPQARVVLLGDKDQLASVEAGAVLGDICNHGEPLLVSNELAEQYRCLTGDAVPGDVVQRSPAPLSANIVELKKNYRFGRDTALFRVSNVVNRGDASGALHLLQTNKSNDLTWQRLPPASRLKHALRPMVLERFSGYLRCDNPEAALAGFNQFRVLCTVRQGPSGVAALNGIVEEILTEGGLIDADSRWYRGRPVMVTRNDYNLRLFNGDIGIVWPDKTGELRAWFASAEGNIRQFSTARLPEHETVYAMTIHKSQGSEFGRVLIILPEHESPVLTRELLYTGLTRAREQAELWANEPIVKTAIRSRVERASGLREALWGGNIVPPRLQPTQQELLR